MTIRNSKARRDFIIEQLKADKVQVIASIETHKGSAPEVNGINTNEQVTLILDSHGFFNSFGKEKITLTACYNGDNSLLKINIFSRSPDMTEWSERDITLLCDSEFIYRLSNV